MSIADEYASFDRLYFAQAGEKYRYHPGARRLAWWAWNAGKNDCGADNFLGRSDFDTQKKGVRIYTSTANEQFERWFCLEYMQPDKPERKKNGEYKQKIHRLMFEAFCASRSS